MRKIALLLLTLCPYICFCQCSAGYTEPTFQLVKTDESCQLTNGSIHVTNLSGGAPPYVFTIIAPSAAGVGTSNATGVFDNLPGGQYYIQLIDGCGSIRVRQTTVLPYDFAFTYTISKLGCDTGRITITPNPPGNYTYGTVSGTDTTWSSSQTFLFELRNQVTVMVKDSCGNIRKSIWTAPTGFLPFIDAIDHLFYCNGWKATVVAHGFTNPTYCIYKSGVLWACNNTGVFDNLPSEGLWCAKVYDSCYQDERCMPDSNFGHEGVQLDPYNFSCNTFSMHVDGLDTLVCLYDSATMQQIACDSSGEFHNLPYGSYCSFIYDPCNPGVYKVCKTVGYPYTFNAISYPRCSLTQTEILVDFSPESRPPFHITVNNPDGTLFQSVTSATATNYFNVPIVPGLYQVIASDSCGHADTSYIAAIAFRYRKHVEAVTKCPGALWSNGSGDATVTVTANSGTLIPVIIKKNNVPTVINYTNFQDSVFHFIDLEPATYIVKYNSSVCSTLELYDTLTVNPYVYPSQYQSAIYQCDNLGFTLNAVAHDGLAPYTYQIIGSTPSAPSVTTAAQSSPVFQINTGTTYSAIRLRVVDGCGNSAIGEVGIVPFQNVVLTAIDTCFFQTMTLSVTHVPNAIYKWYRKTSATDSVLVGGASVYTSYITPDSVGKYICKMVVGDSCITRLTSFNLTGNCHQSLSLGNGPGRNITGRDSSIRVYPNPSGASFHIRFSQSKKYDYRIEVIAQTGVVLLEQELSRVDRKDLVIDRPFPSGYYIVRITNKTTGRQEVVPHIVIRK